MNKEHGTLKKIEVESKKFIGINNVNAAEEFRQLVLENLFLENLRYKDKIPFVEQKKAKITIGTKLIIKITLDEIEERKVSDQLFMEYKDGKVVENLTEWGILITPKGIWLFNSKISLNKKEIFRNRRTILEIIHGKNTDQKYFEFFSYDNIVGDDQKTNFFRDIIEYKNCYYKGTEKSWSAYHSALKRFFKYYSKGGIYFKDDDSSIYDRIQLPDFYWYANYEMKVAKENTLKNAFFYIKDFMHCMSDNTAFDISTKDMIAGFSRTFDKDEKQNIMDMDKLKKAVRYLTDGKNKERDVALFLMVLAFGLERRKLCMLKWDNVEEQDQWILKQDGREVPIPEKVTEALKRLKDLHISSKYVFYRTKENKEEPMREAAVNEVFSKLAKVDQKDSFYRLLTPANIRSSIIQYLLGEGCPLEEIIYLVNIEIWNLGNYFSRNIIDEIVDERSRKNVNCTEGRKTCKQIHPMDCFFNLLLS